MTLAVNQLVGFGVVGATSSNFGATTDAMPAMTSNTAPSGTCSASSSFGALYLPFNLARNDAVDDTIENKQWLTASGATGWWQYQFPTATGIGGYTIRCGTTGQETRMPKSWTLLASNTGAFSGEQVTLDTQTDVATWTSGQRRTYTFTNSTAYTHYRLNVTANHGDSFLQIGEIELLN